MKKIDMAIEADFQTLKSGRFLNKRSGHMIADDCHDFGSMFGCAEDCPTLLNGECREIEEVLNNIDISQDKKQQLIQQYEKIKEE